MSGKFSRAVKERAGVIRRVYWRMSFKIMAGAYSAIGALTLGVGEFATPGVQHDLMFRVLMHHIPTWAWPTAALAILAISGVEGSVQENRRLQRQYAAALASQKARKENESAAALLRIEQERRYEGMCPELEARITSWAGRRNFGQSHYLEVRIRSRWPLATIFATFPADPRTGPSGFDLEAPQARQLSVPSGKLDHSRGSDL